MSELNIPNGGYGKTRDGRKVGPLFHDRFISPNEMFYRGTDDLPDGWYCDGFTIRDGRERPEDLIAEWTDGPVRTVTRTVTEIVEGQYGRIRVCPHLPNAVLVGFTDGSGDWDYTSLTASELKAAAAVLLELAGALE